MRLTVRLGLAWTGILVLACAPASSFAAFAGLTVQQNLYAGAKSTNDDLKKTDNEASGPAAGLMPTSISATETATEPGWNGTESATAHGTASYALLGDDHLQQSGLAFSDTGAGIVGGTWDNESVAGFTETASFTFSDLTQVLLNFQGKGEPGEDYASVVLTDLDTSQQIYSHTVDTFFGLGPVSQFLTLAPGEYQLTSIGRVASDASWPGGQFSNPTGQSSARLTTDLEIVPLPPALLPCTLGIAAIAVGRFLRLRRISAANR